jgi:type VI secretion system protein ImpA
MKRQIDLESLLNPVSDDNPAGDDLRYTDVYEQIKEARRFDDPLEQGDWKIDRKTADWDKVITVAIDALSSKTKDLQIAAWLTEALIMTEGFGGLALGLTLVKGLMEYFWESLYPLIEDDDLEYRMAPLEFMNEKLSPLVKQIPLTDPSKSIGCSLIQWQETRDTSSEHEGKLTIEEFEKAVAATSAAFHKAMSDNIVSCTTAFRELDALSDERFGTDAPRLAELGSAIEECSQVVQRICKEKGLASSSDAGPAEESPPEKEGREQEDKLSAPSQEGWKPAAATAVPQGASGWPSALIDASFWEQALWDEAVNILNKSGVKKAMAKLLEASLNAPSIREQSRVRLLLARLSLKAGRSDLARPILEQLNTLVEELRLEQWESPVWVADVLGSLYQCLTGTDSTDNDLDRASGLFQKLCTIDITKAYEYKGQ